MKGALVRLLPAFALLTLIGCGGDGGAPSGTALDTVSPEPAPAYTGRALKGAVHDGLVVAEWWNAGLWQELDRTHSDHGWFRLDIGDIEGLVRITVSASPQRASQMVCDVPAGCGSTAFTDMLALPEDFRLTTLVTAQQVRAGDIAVTPITHLMARWAESLPGGVSGDGLVLARERVAALFDLPSDFTQQLPADPADLTAFSVADSAAKRHGMLAAAFAVPMHGMSISEVLESVADNFTSHAGQLPLDGETGLRRLISAAQTIAADLQQSEQHLAALLDRLEQWAQVSAANASLPLVWDQDRFEALSGKLDYYASGAALLDLDAALGQRTDQYLWLSQAQLPAIGQVAYTTAGHVLDAVVNGERKLLESNSQCSIFRINRCYTYVVLHQDEQYSAILRAFPSVADLLGFLTGGSISPRLEIVGQMHGQQVDINLRVPTPGSQLFSGALNQVRLEVISAEVSNQIAVASLSGDLAVGLPGLDIMELLNALVPLVGGSDDPLAVAQTLISTLGSASELQVTLQGQGSLARHDALDVAFTGQLDLESALSLTLPGSGLPSVARLELRFAEFVTPAGDRLYSLPGQDGLSFAVDTGVSLQVAMGLALQGLPEAELSYNGNLAGWSPAGDLSVAWPGHTRHYQLSWLDKALQLNEVGSSDAALALMPVSDRGALLLLGEQVIATLTGDPLTDRLTAHFIDGDRHDLSALPLLALFSR